MSSAGESQSRRTPEGRHNMIVFNGVVRNATQGELSLCLCEPRCWRSFPKLRQFDRNVHRHGYQCRLRSRYGNVSKVEQTNVGGHQCRNRKKDACYFILFHSQCRTAPVYCTLCNHTDNTTHTLPCCVPKPRPLS